MEEIQELVTKLEKEYNLETTSEIRVLDLVSEVGELSKEILKGNDYGKKQYEKTPNLENEIGDIMFSLICIANGMNIDLKQALNNVIEKYEKRFGENGHIGS